MLTGGLVFPMLVSYINFINLRKETSDILSCLISYICGPIIALTLKNAVSVKCIFIQFWGSCTFVFSVFMFVFKVL